MHTGYLRTVEPCPTCGHCPTYGQYRPNVGFAPHPDAWPWMPYPWWTYCGNTWASGPADESKTAADCAPEYENTPDGGYGPPPTETDFECWVVERSVMLPGGYWDYLSADGGNLVFIDGINRAIRFSRKQDAERVLEVWLGMNDGFDGDRFTVIRWAHTGP